MSYILALQSPVYDGRDAITGWRTRLMPEYGFFETIGMAFKKADLLHDEFRLDLGDGDNIQVWEDGRRVHRAPSAQGIAYWPADPNLPF